MRKGEMRTEARIAIARKGALHSGGDSFPCVLQNMSDNGFLFLCTRPLKIGQPLQLRCELFPDRVLQCALKVVHSGNGEVGGRIIAIDEDNAKLLHIFLEEQYVGKLGR